MTLARIALALLIPCAVASTAKAQIPSPPAVGSTTVYVQAKGVGQNQVIPSAGSVTVKVTVIIEKDEAWYPCDLCATVDIKANSKTRAEVAKELAEKLKDNLAALNCLFIFPGLWIDVHGDVIDIQGTLPGFGENEGTPEKPITSRPGRLTNDPRVQYFTE